MSWAVWFVCNRAWKGARRTPWQHEAVLLFERTGGRGLRFRSGEQTKHFAGQAVAFSMIVFTPVVTFV